LLPCPPAILSEPTGILVSQVEGSPGRLNISARDPEQKIREVGAGFRPREGECAIELGVWIDVDPRWWSLKKNNLQTCQESSTLDFIGF
jgi:hypothetical protein